jgi:membrane protease YdiL (CAAX protease family)
MNAQSTSTARYALSAYLILTPLISLAIALFLPIPPVAIALILILVAAIMGILMAAITEGGRGVADLLKKLLQWRVNLKWYAAALGLPAAIMLASGGLAVLLGWMPAVQISAPERPVLIVNTILIALVAVLEELGWRGYALPRLLNYRSPLASATLIGVAWGILHLGIGLLDGRPWLPTILVPLAASVPLTWLFVHTRGSLTMAVLYHFALDYSPQFVLFELTIEQAVWVQAIAGLALALILILVTGANLQRSPAKRAAVADLG